MGAASIIIHIAPNGQRDRGAGRPRIKPGRFGKDDIVAKTGSHSRFNRVAFRAYRLSRGAAEIKNFALPSISKDRSIGVSARPEPWQSFTECIKRRCAD
jgi:hypothetical protein